MTIVKHNSLVKKQSQPFQKYKENQTKDNNINSVTSVNKIHNIEQFLEENELQEISYDNKNQIIIYAKNVPVKEENELSVPMMPSILNIVLNGKKEYVVVESDVIQSNDSLYIAKTDNDGKIIDMQQIPLKKHKDVSTNKDKEANIIITPPQIGQ